MKLNKEFRIKGLKVEGKYKNAAPIILDSRLQEILKRIDKFFFKDTIENLHSLRIAFRKFRYVMEIFYGCIDEELFNYVYNYAREMQDLIGEGRDLDVLKIKLNEIQNSKKGSINSVVFDSIEKENLKIRQKIKMELIKFMIDKNVNRFLINKKRG